MAETCHGHLATCRKGQDVNPGALSESSCKGRRGYKNYAILRKSRIRTTFRTEGSYKLPQRLISLIYREGNRCRVPCPQSHSWATTEPWVWKGVHLISLWTQSTNPALLYHKRSPILDLNASIFF